jgi:AcrR family transcriptional regulator
MARKATITNEQILEAAREVFLEKGIRATVAEVAERAGIAGGSVFNRFTSKEELFCAAMRADMGDPAWMPLLERHARSPNVDRALIEIGRELIAFFRKILPVMMMSWSNTGEKGVPPHLEAPDPPPLRGLRLTTAFFESQMRLGHIARHDPEILARVFLGSLLNYVFFELVMQAHAQRPLPEQTYLRGLVQLLFKGIEPRRDRRPRGRARRVRAQMD